MGQNFFKNKHNKAPINSRGIMYKTIYDKLKCQTALVTLPDLKHLEQT